MSELLTVGHLTEVFVTLFVIMDPVGTIPIFLSLTRGRSAASLRRAAWQAVLVSFGVITAFNVMLHRTGKRPDAEWDRLAHSVPTLFGRAGELLRGGA